MPSRQQPSNRASASAPAGSRSGRPDDRRTAASVATLAAAFCLGGALTLAAFSASRARAQTPGAPAEGAVAAARAELQVVAPVDLERYSGRWHEQARLPNRFQKQCAGEVSADYARQPDGNIEVRNRCRRSDGVLDESIGEAKVVEVPGRPNAGRLKVRFAPKWLSWLPFVWGDYLILRLDPDYRVALIGTPDRKFLWVLSRDARLDEATLAAQLEQARSLGFDVDRVVRSDDPAKAPATPTAAAAAVR